MKKGNYVSYRGKIFKITNAGKDYAYGTLLKESSKDLYFINTKHATVLKCSKINVSVFVIRQALQGLRIFDIPSHKYSDLTSEKCEIVELYNNAIKARVVLHNVIAKRVVKNTADDYYTYGTPVIKIIAEEKLHQEYVDAYKLIEKQYGFTEWCIKNALYKRERP